MFGICFCRSTNHQLLFVCSGCIENQANQLGHVCVMLSSSEEALNSQLFGRGTDLAQVFDIQSCVPSLVLQRYMEDEQVCNEEYIKQSISSFAVRRECFCHIFFSFAVQMVAFAVTGIAAILNQTWMYHHF